MLLTGVVRRMQRVQGLENFEDLYALEPIDTCHENAGLMIRICGVVGNAFGLPREFGRNRKVVFHVESSAYSKGCEFLYRVTNAFDGFVARFSIDAKPIDLQGIALVSNPVSTQVFAKFSPNAEALVTACVSASKGTNNR